MLTLGVLFVTLICCQGGWCERRFPRVLFGSFGGANGGSSSMFSQGGPMAGSSGGSGSMFPQGGPMVGPSYSGGPGGNPTKQQHNSIQSMVPGGSCLPLDQCACPNKAFRGPTGCYICSCDGSQSLGPGTGQILPTPLIISAGTRPSTSKPTVNNQTPPKLPTASPVTVAMSGRTTSAPSSGQCQSAARFCLLNCPAGYLVDPNDCMFCVCKSNVAGR